MARPKLHLKLKEGALHKELGVPAGAKIPAGKISSAKHSSDPLLRKRANFAANEAKWKK